MWTINSALTLVRALNPKLKKIGYGIGLTGSVLTKAESEKDLDLIVYPLSTSQTNYKALTKTLKAAELTLVANRQRVLRVWASIGSTDTKFVEVWQDKNDRRIDIFHLS